MSKRYLRLDIEYDMELASKLRMTGNNIKVLLHQHMPYCTIIFTRDTSVKEHLDDPKFKHTL